MSPTQKRVLRIVGLVFLGIATFLVTLSFAFPYERTKGKLIELLSDKYDVTVGSAGRGLLPGEIVFERIVLRSRPTKPDEKVKEFVIDRLEVDLGLDYGLIGAIRQKVSVDIDAELGGGEIEGEIDASKSMVAASFETDSLSLGNLPGVADAVGLPMTGNLDADIEIRLPGGKWRDAEGHIEIDCDGCVIGDGVSKMTLSGNKRPGARRRTTAWGDEARSITVPRLNLGETAAVVEISKGIGEIKSFSAESKDGWLKITGKIEFRDPFSSSLFPGCMQFRLSDELKKREPNFGNIEFGISEKLRQTDGSFAIPTRGKLTELRWDPRRRCGGGPAEEEEGGESGERPTLAGRPALGEPGDTSVEPTEVPGVSGATVAPLPGSSGPPLGEPPAAPPADAGPSGTAGAPPPEERDAERNAKEQEAERNADGRDQPAPATDDERPAPVDDRDPEDRRTEDKPVD